METSHFHIPPPISTVLFLQFLRWNWFSHASYTLSFPPWLLRSKPITIVEDSRKENSFCSACWHLQDFTHLFLDCLTTEPLCKSIFGSAVCTLARDSTVGSVQSSVASSSFGRGWVAPPLNQAASDTKTMQYASQIVENNLAIVSNMKKSTLMQQHLSVNMTIVLIRKLPICTNC